MVLENKLASAFALAGIAIPNLGVIDIEEKLENYRKAFSKALITAPLSNIILKY